MFPIHQACGRVCYLNRFLRFRYLLEREVRVCFSHFHENLKFGFLHPNISNGQQANYVT